MALKSSDLDSHDEENINSFREFRKRLNQTYTDSSLQNATAFFPGLDSPNAEAVHDTLVSAVDAIVETAMEDARITGELLDYNNENAAVENMLRKRASFLVDQRWRNIVRQYDSLSDDASTIQGLFEELNPTAVGALFNHALKIVDGHESATFSNDNPSFDRQVAVWSRMANASEPIVTLKDRVERDSDLNDEQSAELFEWMTGGVELAELRNDWITYTKESAEKLVDYIIDESGVTEDIEDCRTTAMKSLLSGLERQSRVLLSSEYGTFKDALLNGDDLGQKDPGSFPDSVPDSLTKAPFTNRSVDSMRTFLNSQRDVISSMSGSQAQSSSGPDKATSGVQMG